MLMYLTVNTFVGKGFAVSDEHYCGSSAYFNISKEHFQSSVCLCLDGETDRIVEFTIPLSQNNMKLKLVYKENDFDSIDDLIGKMEADMLGHLIYIASKAHA